MSGQDIVRAAQTSHEVTLSSNQVDLLKRTICKGATDDELQLFLATSQRLGLDPFSKQIHAVKRRERVQVDGRWDWQEIMSIQVGVDGFRLAAQRSGRYAGQEGTWWCGPDGVWREVWATADQPVAAKVVVLLHGAGGIVKVPAVAHWREYAGTKNDGSLTRMWQTKGPLMLAKCAECLALRKAFPAELSGIYSPDEMQQASNPPGAAPAPLTIEPSVVPIDDRPERVALLDSLRGRGLTKRDVRALLHAALSDLGVPEADDIDVRLRSASPGLLVQAAKNLADTPTDAVVVPEAEAAEFAAQMSTLDAELGLTPPTGGSTAAAIEGDS